MKRHLLSLLKRLISERVYLGLYDFYNRVSRFLRALTCVGTGLECPLCGWRFRKFLPAGVDAPVYVKLRVVGGGRRPEGACPHCDCSDKERHLHLYLAAKTGIFRGDPLSLLHVGPERNLQRVLRSRPNIRYLSADIDSPLAMVKMDVTRIQYPDDSFDMILCCHVLEHVPDDRRAISELYRVLKPGGLAILQTPVALGLDKTREDPDVTDPDQKLRLFGQKDHLRIYGRDYRDRLEAAGFTVELYSYAGEFGESAARRYALLKDEELHICRKPAAPKEAGM